MTREAKFNLVFLVALLALSLPGMIILTRKALNGTGGLNASPPDVAISTPYLHPVGVAPGVTRSAPPLTLAWVDEVAESATGRPALRLSAAGNRPVPIIGEAFRLELLDANPDSRATPNAPAGTVTLLAWQHAADAPPAEDFVVSVDGEPAVVLALEPREVPQKVLKELQAYGYPRPPATAVVLTLALPSADEGGEDRGLAGRTIAASWARGDERRGDTLALPAGIDRLIADRIDAAAPSP